MKSLVSMLVPGLPASGAILLSNGPRPCNVRCNQRHQSVVRTVARAACVTTAPAGIVAMRVAIRPPPSAPHRCPRRLKDLPRYRCCHQPPGCRPPWQAWNESTRCLQCHTACHQSGAEGFRCWPSCHSDNHGRRIAQSVRPKFWGTVKVEKSNTPRVGPPACASSTVGVEVRASVSWGNRGKFSMEGCIQKNRAPRGWRGALF